MMLGGVGSELEPHQEGGWEEMLESWCEAGFRLGELALGRPCDHLCGQRREWLWLVTSVRSFIGTPR